ncbi:uncharacterized protein LOC122088020 isoform X2 [Macadamia integrifolia]|uniref:uncharacterized protein LOC122088020 isoform X2 n=1 Tax=Macadamia integrifolia TaxID=60698 RepID=UPI001C4E7DE0|nr:uncharacterized protein LOC122088020 isoform X2 [Macadamia integrifolia]
MGNHDHGKNHTTGHDSHGSHICHKCGWPFPNPHPSAKQRRSHKKVCGTLEGYKLTDPDEEQMSDEDHKGSVLGELKSNENVKHGIQRIESSKSEEDLFSDAVAEFGDTGTSPTIETVVAKGTRSPEVNVKGDVIQEPEHSVQGSQLEKPQGLESSVDNLKSNNLQVQIDSSSFTVDKCLASSSDKETEAVAVDGRKDAHNCASFVSDVNHDERVNLIPEIANIKTGDDVTDRSLMHSGHSFEGHMNENSDANGHFPHLVASPSKPLSMEVSEIDSRLEQMDEFAGVTADVSTTRINAPIDRLVDSKEEQSKLSGPVIPQIDSSSNSCSGPMEVVGIEHMGTMIASERDASVQEVSVAYPSETVDGCNVKAEPNDKIPALSTSTVIPAERHSDVTIKDCRDHGPGTSDTHGAVIKEEEDHPKILASEEDNSSFLLNKLDEGDACSGQQVHGKNLQQEGTVSKSMVEERFNEYETDSFECKASIRGDGSNGSEVPPALSSDVTSTCSGQAQTFFSIEKQRSHDSNHDLSQEILPERSTVIHETVGAAMVSTSDNEVDSASYAINSNDFPEKAIIGTDNVSNGLEALPDSEILPEKPAVIPEGGGDAVVFPADTKVDGASNSISSSSDFPEKDGTDHSNLAGKYIGDGVVEVRQGEDFQEVQKGVDTSRCTDYSSLTNLESQAEYVDTANIRVSEALHEDIKVDHDIAWFFPSGAENFSQNEHHMASALNTESWVPSSVPVEDNNDNDLCGDFSDINSQSLQNDGDHNLKHQLSASDVVHTEFSVKSDGQTDHMKGYSGSASEKMVPSTINATNEQAILSAEILQVYDIRAEEANLKRTSAEESTTGFGRDKFDVGSQPLQDKAANNHHKHYNEGIVPSTSDATDELVILATDDTLQASNTQSQKADLMNTFSEENSTKDFGEDTFEIKYLPLQDDDVNDVKKHPSASAAVSAGVFVDSSSQADSVEGYWGSVSDSTFPSTRDANEESPIIATETIAMSDTGVMDRDQKANLETKVGASERELSGHSDLFDAPSFMTSVESGKRNDQLTTSSEIQTVQNPQQPNSSPLQDGWFPSLAYDAKESEGRKKNEEIIAKVSNWSAGKPHTPLRSLLVEANLESLQKPSNGQEHPATVATKDEASAQDNKVAPKTSPPVTAPEESTALSAQGDQEKEWNTPARLPESKKEKRKGRGNWVPFVCCTSVDLDP